MTNDVVKTAHAAAREAASAKGRELFEEVEKQILALPIEKGYADG